MEAYMPFFIFSFFVSSFPLSLSQQDKEYKDCQPSICGSVGEIAYPFWSENDRPHYCGRPEFKLYCPPHEQDYPSIQIGSQTFNVTYINRFTYKMTLVRTDFEYDNCSSHFTNTSLTSTPLNLFHYDDPYVNVTLFYDCSTDYSIGNGRFEFPCQPGTSSDSNPNNSAFYTKDVVNVPRFPEIIKNCKHHIQVPVSEEPDPQDTLLEALRKGFRVRYDGDESCGKCWDSHGRCGSDSNDTSQFICYCRDGHHPLSCPHSSSMLLHLLLSRLLLSLQFHSLAKFIHSYAQLELRLYYGILFDLGALNGIKGMDAETSLLPVKPNESVVIQPDQSWNPSSYLLRLCFHFS